MHELSPKQLRSFLEAQARFNVWVGSVRSGKSFAANLAFLKFVRSEQQGDMIILGRSEQALKRNIINPMLQLLGTRAQFYHGKRELHIGNRTIYVVGANDARAAAKIQGATFLGALVDEISILPETVWNMLLSRLSLPGARLFGTTNPDSPYHWLKVNFLDRQNELNLKYWDFDFSDNPTLGQDYIDNLKKEYRGLWYQRYIEGKWVLAEGAIYDFFDEKEYVIDAPPGNADYYIVGIDYGTTNPCVFTLIGYSSKTFPNMWMEKEYYYDSQKAMRQKTDSEYGDDLAKFITGYNVKQIYIDPSAVSIRVELRRQGISNVFEANNDVMNGLRYQTDLLANGTYKICANCKNTIAEYTNYVWDARAAQRGLEKPLKVNDHTKDAERYALYTHFFDRPMVRLKPEDIDNMWREVSGEGRELPPPFQNPLPFHY